MAWNNPHASAYRSPERALLGSLAPRQTKIKVLSNLCSVVGLEVFCSLPQLLESSVPSSYEMELPDPCCLSVRSCSQLLEAFQSSLPYGPPRSFRTQTCAFIRISGYSSLWLLPLWSTRENSVLLKGSLDSFMPTPDNFPFYNIMEHNHWSDTHHIQRSHLHSMEEDYTKIKKVFGNHLRILPTIPLVVLNRWSTAVSLSTNSDSWRQSIDASMVQNTQSWVPPNLWWQI